MRGTREYNAGMRRWVVTVVVASVAVVIALVALWFAVAPRFTGGGSAQGADARAIDGGAASQIPVNDGAAGPGQEARSQCTGRYADSLELISARNREYEKSPESNYSYCVRNTATYEQVYYDAEGKLQKRHLKSTIHGTAFVYREKNGEYFLLTNEHIAEQPEVTGEGSRLDGIPFGSKKVSEVVKIVKNEDDAFEKNHVVLTRVVADPLLDAAVLKTTHRLNPCPYKIGISGELRTGNAVMMKGFPLGIFTVSNTGKVTNVRIEDTDGEWQHADFVVDAQLNTGQSGSPVMAINCQTGELEIVGLFHAFYSAAKGLNLAVHIDELNDLLNGMKPRRRDKGVSGGFLGADDQFRVVSYLLDRKNLGVFRYGGYFASAEIEKDRAMRFHLHTDAYPSNPLPRVTFIDGWRRTYGEIDQVIFTRPSGKQVVRKPAELPDDVRRHLQKLYADLWQQLLKTMAYRDLLAYSQENEDLYKRTAARLSDVEGYRKSQTEQVETVLFDVDKVLGQEDSRSP